jgi:site-specific recombinase XerD
MSNIIDFNKRKDRLLYAEYFISKYKVFLETEDKSPLTVKEYTNCATHFLAFLEVSIDDLDHLHMIHYQSELQDKQKLASTTINKKLHAIKSFLAWLCDNDYIAKDISRKIKTIKIQNQRVSPKSLNDKEVNLILQFCGTSKASVKLRNYAMIQLMLNTGIRVSELVNLNYEDVDINERSGSILIKQGKGSKDRKVLLNSKARNALTNYFNHRIEKLNGCISNDSPSIASQSEKRMSVRGIQLIVQELSKKAKITRIRVSPHTFRHTFATRYHNETKDLVGLAALCGHSSLNTTAKYSLPSEDQLLLGLDRI